MIKYFYDKEADVFYFSQGKPGTSDETIETDGDILLRVDRRTNKVRGFTLLNASRRKHSASRSTSLPFTLTPTAEVRK